MRSGDRVLHRPTGETWLVAYVDESDYLAWYGWPEGVVPASECTLVRACTDAEHERSLREWAEKPHRRDSGAMDRRALVCQRQLDELLERRDLFVRIRAVTSVRFQRGAP